MRCRWVCRSQLESGIKRWEKVEKKVKRVIVRRERMGI